METIYTIPVNEAFEKDCECPICELRKRFEANTIEYFAGPSLMEPDTRIMTNEVGFCGRHFEQLYNLEAKKLGIGLMLDTYMQEQIAKIKKYAGNTAILEENDNQDADNDKTPKKGLFGLKKATSAKGSNGALVNYLKKHETACAVCEKLNYTMDRYNDIIFQLYGDKDFRAKLANCKGFCLPHFRMLVELAPSKLSSSKAESFVDLITKIEIENLERIEKEVDWFTKKFDYRNQNADWGNSRDALPRGILKMSGAKDIIK